MQASVAKEAIRCNGHLTLLIFGHLTLSVARGHQISDGYLTLIQAIDLFLAAKAAQGISPKTASWYRMILARLGRAFDADQGVDGLTAPALRGWIVGLQTTLAPVSIAGYVRTHKAFGNWLHAEELADAAAFRGLRKPRVPDVVGTRKSFDGPSDRAE